MMTLYLYVDTWLAAHVWLNSVAISVENQRVRYSQYCSNDGIHTTKALWAQVKERILGSYKECDVTRVEDQSN